MVVLAAALAVFGACTRPGVAEPPTPSAQPPSSGVANGADSAAYAEQEVRQLLAASTEFEPFSRDREQDERMFRAVEHLGRDVGQSSLDTLFAVLLASAGDLHLQRAALFSLVRRAPASLEVARQLLDGEVPAVSRLVHVDPNVSRSQQRSYERGLAAAVLGTSGLAAARAPLLAALVNTQGDLERVLFVVALARLARHGESPELLLEALAKTPADAQVSGSFAWGLVQLLPDVQDLLLPCSFEIMRIGSPALAIEVLASAAEDRAAEQLAPALLALAERVGASNAEASTKLMLSAAHLAAPPVFTSVRERLQDPAAGHAEWSAAWVTELGGAFSRCAEDLACHYRALGEPTVDTSHLKSALFVAARAAADQGPAVLTQMEHMSRPYWLAHALDQRLTQPSAEQLVRVQKLTQRGPENAALYAPHSACSRFDSPLEELAIRLEARARSDG